MKFDASQLESISSIASATIAPSNANVDVALISSALTFAGDVKPVALNLKNTTGTVISSDSTFITTAATANGTIVLSGVSIAGSAAKNLTKGGWNLKPGVQYQLDITLKKSIEVNIGDEVWALGNLTYAVDESGNPVYGFAKQLQPIWGCSLVNRGTLVLIAINSCICLMADRITIITRAMEWGRKVYIFWQIINGCK